MTDSSSLATCQYLVQARGRIFVNGHGFFNFLKRWAKISVKI